MALEEAGELWGRLRPRCRSVTSQRTIPAILSRTTAIEYDPWGLTATRTTESGSGIAVNLVHEMDAPILTVVYYSFWMRKVKARGARRRGTRSGGTGRAAEALRRLRDGRGRPPAGREVGPTEARSIRLPAPVWAALEAQAARTGTTVHALLRDAVRSYLIRSWRSRRRRGKP